jgi:hypothetical protein
MNVTIKFDVTHVSKMQKEIPQHIIPVALARSLNKTLQATNATAVKAIATNIGMKQKTIRDFLAMTKAQRQRLLAILSAPHKRRLTLLNIDPRASQNARGVAYRGGAQKRQIDHAFIAVMKNGHRGIYARKPGAGRLPIRELQGASIPHVFIQPEIQQQMKTTLACRWQPILDHEVKYELQRRGYTR